MHRCTLCLNCHCQCAIARTCCAVRLQAFAVVTAVSLVNQPLLLCCASTQHCQKSQLAKSPHITTNTDFVLLLLLLMLLLLQVCAKDSDPAVSRLSRESLHLLDTATNGADRIRRRSSSNKVRACFRMCTYSTTRDSSMYALVSILISESLLSAATHYTAQVF
jgi:hypothetical protein